MDSRVQYRQRCFPSFQGGVVRNEYLTCNVKVDEKGNIDSSNPDLENAIHWIHDADRKGIVCDPMDNRAYRLNASWEIYCAVCTICITQLNDTSCRYYSQQQNRRRNGKMPCTNNRHNFISSFPRNR
jgi:hypothetical protein